MGADVATVDEVSGMVTIQKSGKAVISATRATDDRYLPTTAQMTITISKTAQSGFGFASPRVVKTYGDTAFTVSAVGGQSTGAVTYAVTAGRGVISINETTGRVSIQNTGTAVITATRAEDGRYSAATHTITIDVDKAETFVIAPPVASNIEVIGKLSAIMLSGGEGSVPGRFSWADPDQIISVSGKYHAVFTPEDTGRYKPSTCEVQVNVIPVLVHAFTGIQFDLSQASVPSGITSVNVSLAQIETDAGNLAVDDMTDLVNADDKFSGSVFAVYDLALLDQSGQPITEFSGAITVRIPVPDDMSGDLRVFWFDSQTKTMTDMNARLEDGWLVFETTHFSYYAVVQMTALTPPAPVTAISPDTGTNSPHIVLWILAGVVVGGLAAFIIVRKKRKI
jgi:LPXTG-motif cell wall-anchored protein